jgi:protein SCO1
VTENGNQLRIAARSALNPDSWPCRRVTQFILAAMATAVIWTAAIAQDRQFTLTQPITLVDANGSPVSGNTFPGKWLLIYFGYTHCSELCPTALSTMMVALDEIGPAADYLQPLFVTVDPERDNGPILRSFTASFDKRLIGLGGAPEQINAAASALGVRYEKVLLSESDYVVDHSSSFSLVDPTGRHATTFQVSEPHQIAAKLVDILYRAEVNLDKVMNLGAFR